MTVYNIAGSTDWETVSKSIIIVNGLVLETLNPKGNVAQSHILS